jgi:hypothetical protein
MPYAPKVEATGNNNNNSIQFNSILIYLHANLTAQWPITK